MLLCLLPLFTLVFSPVLGFPLLWHVIQKNTFIIFNALYTLTQFCIFSQVYPFPNPESERPWVAGLVWNLVSGIFAEFTPAASPSVTNLDQYRTLKYVENVKHTPKKALSFLKLIVSWDDWGFSFPKDSVQFSCSVVSNSLQHHGLQHARLPCPSPTPELAQIMSIKSVMPSNHLILCCPLLLLPSIFPSIRVFSSESVFLIRWLKYHSFSFGISPCNEYSGLISFRMDCLHLLVVQETLDSPPTPQFKSINSSVLSFLYGPTLTSLHDYWKNHSFDYMDLCQQSNVSAF